MTTPKRNEAVVVDRYHLTAAYGCAVMEEHPDGDYVLYTDYVSDLSALQGEVSRLRAVERRYLFLRDGDGEVFWQDAYEAIGSAFVGDHIDLLIDEAMKRHEDDNLEPPTDG